jgi:Cd2+/Zn2+-exporting ATPase
MSEVCCHGDGCAPLPAATAAAAAAPDAGRRPILRLVLAGGLIAAGAAAVWLDVRPAATIAYAAAAIMASATPFARAWRSVRARRLDINLLMIVAVAGAMALGDWFEAATVVWLFDLSAWLEARTMARATRAIRSLVTLAPEVATVIRDGEEAERPVGEVRPGDHVIVRPGQRVPVDGIVVAGESVLDESTVTGESWPVEKSPADSVFAGTVNGTGALEVRVTRPASDSTIARVGRLVDEAARRRAPVQQLVDRFARWYTPAVAVLALLVAVVPPLATGVDGAWATWTYRAITLLVVACPCALVISTPVSIVSALTAAAHAGVLIKGGAHLERLADITAVAFDKTGTLADARLAIAGVMGVDGVSADGVLLVAAALESRSEHPIGRAIVDRARAAGVAVAPGDGYRALPGLGAEALVGASPAVIGSHRLFESRRLCTPALHAGIEAFERQGATPVLVGHGGAALGVIGFIDRLRTEGRGIAAALRAEGVQRVALLTGDRAASADALGAEAGLDEAHGDLLPADKLAHIDRLRAAYGPVAMVGDGVNDAPALAAADVGIAMGTAGTGVALETADVALMSDDLSRLPYVLRLGRRTRTNIRINVAIALGFKLLFIALAAFGVATLWMAVLADTGASLVVTANSLRLLKADRIRT